MKRILFLLMALLTGVGGAWAYSTTRVTSAQDSKGNSLVSGGFYRILLPSRDASVALQQNGEYVKANNGLGIIGFMWKIEEDTNGKALISNPAGGYWKFTEHADGHSKLKTNGTISDCTAFQMAWYSSASKTLNLFDNSVEGSGYSYDNIYCGYVLSNHSGIGNNMGIYNNITDPGSIFKFERFYQTLFVIENTDVNGVAVESYPSTVTINGNVTTSEYYTNSENPITSFSTAYAAKYYIGGVEKTADEVMAAINANTATLTVTVKPQPFVASTNEAPVYYALMISGNANSWLEANVSNVNCAQGRALPGVTGRDAWTWQLIQDGTNGYRIYNASADKYIGGRTATGGNLVLGDVASANAFIAVYNNATTIKFKDQINNLWIDRSGGYTYAHTSGQQFTFKRMYKVTFSDEVAINGGDAVSSIFVSADGSDTFTLPSDKLYSINGAEAVGYADAATAIAACSSNLTVTVSDNSTKNVTYILKWSDGTTLNTVENVETELLNPTSDYVPSAFVSDFTTLSYSPETIGSETTEVTVTATWNGPFQLSASTTNAKWYTVGMHSTYKSNNNIWKYIDDSNMDAVPVATDAYQSLSDANCFAFLGNPYDGITIYSKGAQKYVVKGDDTERATFDESGTLFIPILPNDKTIADGYTCFLVKEGSNHLNGWTESTGLSIHGGTNPGPGSTCWFIPAGQYYLNFIDGLALDAPVGAVGTKAYFTTVANPTTEKSNITGYRSTIANNLYLDVSSTNLGGFNAALDNIRNSETIALADGYYRVVSAVPGFNATAAWYYNPAVSTTNIVWAKAATTTEHQVNSIFKFTANENKWNIYSPNAQQYITTGNGEWNVQNAALGEAAPLTIEAIGSAQYTFMQNGNSQTIHAMGHDSGNGTNGTLITWNANGVGQASAWYVLPAEKISITLNNGGDDNYYATLCLPFDVTISGATAYMLTLNDAQTYLTMDELPGGEVPAGTPVLLVGTSANATAAIASNAETSAPLTTTSLVGCYTPVTGISNGELNGQSVYTLGKDDEGNIGFFKFTRGSSIGANKAYMTLEANTSVRGFTFNIGDINGVGAIAVSTNGNAPVFDLQGRRVHNASRGIYIQNGKKVLF